MGQVTNEKDSNKGNLERIRSSASDNLARLFSSTNRMRSRQKLEAETIALLRQNGRFLPPAIRV
jgi:hypothetical protein